MSADILDFGRATQILRGPDAELKRLGRVGVRRVAAFRRALNAEYSKADQAMFGPMEQLLAEGPKPDPRLGGRPRSGPSVA